MPATLFGMPAVEVEQPGGEVVKYLVRAVPARPQEGERPEEWRAWEVVKEDDTTYRVSEYMSGRWGCDCPAHTLGKNRGGRWQRVKNRPCCKHIQAVAIEMTGCDRGGESAPTD